MRTTLTQTHVSALKAAPRAPRKKTSPVVRRPREPRIDSEESSAGEDSDPEGAPLPPALPRLAPSNARVPHRTYYGHWSSSFDEDDEDDADFTE